MWGMARRKYIRTIIDIECAPHKPGHDRYVWEGKHPHRLPPQVQDWFARWIEIELIAYVVQVTDSPVWLWEACQFDGRDPGELGCYVIWHTEPDHRREVLYSALALASVTSADDATCDDLRSTTAVVA